MKAPLTTQMSRLFNLLSQFWLFISAVLTCCTTCQNRDSYEAKKGQPCVEAIWLDTP